jgi:hypothetical protein
MNYFFDEEVANENLKLVEFKKIAKVFITQRNYESLNYIYELEKEKTHRLSLSDKLYMQWIAALIDFYFYHKKEEAIESLEKVLQSLHKVDINYLQISNTLFNFYHDIENFTRFESIKEEIIDCLTKLTLNTIEELEVSIKFNYNLSRYFWLQNDMESAIKQIMSTIKLCREYRTTYLLADLYLLLGNISKDFSDKTVVKGYYETAYFLYYNLDDNKEMALRVEHYLAENFQD